MAGELYPPEEFIDPRPPFNEKVQTEAWAELEPRLYDFNNRSDFALHGVKTYIARAADMKSVFVSDRVTCEAQKIPLYAGAPLPFHVGMPGHEVHKDKIMKMWERAYIEVWRQHCAGKIWKKIATDATGTRSATTPEWIRHVKANMASLPFGYNGRSSIETDDDRPEFIFVAAEKMTFAECLFWNKYAIPFEDSVKKMIKAAQSQRKRRGKKD